MARTLLKIAGAVAALAVSHTAQASVFSDDFDAYGRFVGTASTDLTAAFAPNWTVTSGSVDVIGDPAYFNFLPGNGGMVDLGGSTNAFGQLTTVSSFGPGIYELDILIAGTQRGLSNVTSIALGDWSTVVPLADTAALRNYHFSFNTTTAGSLRFLDSGANATVGNLLESVVLSAVPEPTTWALMIAGFAVVGAALRRRSPLRAPRFA